ncbi:MAG TPA: hypothetical protein VK463_10955, partial [Desulfomonilaceae bacterium]|nr:hypothetical protein [Desulfomonilaceae bacterium]
MKKLLTLLSVGLLVAALALPVHAWEFAMNGSFEWTYQYFSQNDRNGFFGTYDVSTAAALGAGNPFYPSMNMWSGARWLNGVNFGLVTGEDAVIQYSRMYLEPEIRVNPAIRIRGKYNIGNR